MSRRIVNITLDNLGDLPPKCRKCVFWELDPVSRERATESGDPELEKESWVSSVLLEWGSCGKIAYVDGVPAGYMLFAGFVGDALGFDDFLLAIDHLPRVFQRIAHEQIRVTMVTLFRDQD